MADVGITVTGLDKVIAAVDKFPREIAHYLAQAGDEASKRQILRTQGLQKYPPMTAANAPPTPYYIRGRGTQTASGNRHNSERLGTNWVVEHGHFYTEIGNRVSYAHWVHGDDQASFMAPKGWRKLWDVANEKLPSITKVYQAWISKLIRDLGL